MSIIDIAAERSKRRPIDDKEPCSCCGVATDPEPLACATCMPTPKPRAYGHMPTWHHFKHWRPDDFAAWGAKIADNVANLAAVWARDVAGLDNDGVADWSARARNRSADQCWQDAENIRPGLNERRAVKLQVTRERLELIRTRAPNGLLYDGLV